MTATQIPGPVRWLNRIVAGFSLRRPVFSARPVYVWYLWWTNQHLGGFVSDYFAFLLSVPIHQCFQLTILCIAYATRFYQLIGSLDKELKIKQAYIPLWEWLEIGISSSPKPRGGRTITCKRRRRWRSVRGTFVSTATSCEHVAVSWSKDSCTVPFTLRSFTTNLYNSASNRFRHLLY